MTTKNTKETWIAHTIVNKLFAILTKMKVEFRQKRGEIEGNSIELATVRPIILESADQRQKWVLSCVYGLNRLLRDDLQMLPAITITRQSNEVFCIQFIYYGPERSICELARIEQTNHPDENMLNTTLLIGRTVISELD